MLTGIHTYHKPLLLCERRDAVWKVWQTNGHSGRYEHLAGHGLHSAKVWPVAAALEGLTDQWPGGPGATSSSMLRADSKGRL